MATVIVASYLSCQLQPIELRSCLFKELIYRCDKS